MAAAVKVKLNQTNDYEAPALNCWPRPLKSNPGQQPLDNPSFNYTSQVSFSSNKDTRGKDFTRRTKAGTNDSDPIKLALNDCLACSGCVTLEEKEELHNRTVDEFLLYVNKKAVIVSISPQCTASFAAHYSLTSLQAFKKLASFFKLLGVKAVFDTNCGRDLALKEACNEFVARYKESLSDKSLPMISSACPGWIEHAEKNLGSSDLPYISPVKSPQQMMGTIIKRYICQQMALRPDEVYHVTVMPCFEKKFEAVRDDFTFQFEYQDGQQVNINQKVAEVDSVLTSSDVLNLIQKKSVDFNTLDESPVDTKLTRVSGDGSLCGVDGTCGGFAETIFRYAAKSLFARIIEGPLEFKQIRTDLHEVCLEVNGKVLLRFALCYGRRNLRFITQKISKGECNYHFLEIMTCPSGCLNGGGQIKRKPGLSVEDSIRLVKKAYLEEVVMADPLQNPIVNWLYEEWLGVPGSAKAQQYTQTAYHNLGARLKFDW